MIFLVEVVDKLVAVGADDLFGLFELLVGGLVAHCERVCASVMEGGKIMICGLEAREGQRGPKTRFIYAYRVSALPKSFLGLGSALHRSKIAVHKR